MKCGWLCGIVLAAAVCFGAAAVELPETAAEVAGETQAAELEATYSDKCGTNVRWTLDTATGVLNITGTGKMTEWRDYSYVPWYSYSSYIKKITIAQGVTSIGDFAFYDCTDLTSVTIPDSVTGIGFDAFYYCPSLSFVDITDLDAWCRIHFGSNDANPLNSGKTNLYCNNKLVKSVTFPADMTEVKSYVFYGYKDLTSAVLPPKAKSIGDYAFCSCSGLTSITIPDSVTSIGSSAFADCSGLTDITIPDSVTRIGNGAFTLCSGLTSVTIPDSVTSIGTGAFKQCSGLTSITIPDSVTSIGVWAFLSTNIRSMTITDLSAWLSVSLGDKNANPLYGNGGSLYLNDTLVKQLVIPDGIATIDAYRFAGARSITSLVLPKSVSMISANAFLNCSNITDIYYLGTADDWDSVRIDANNGSLSTATVHTGYIPDDFDVTFHANTTDTVENMPSAASAIGAYVLPSNIPERDGYTFLGWSFDKNAKKASFAPGDTVNISLASTLYAIWKEASPVRLSSVRLLDAARQPVTSIPSGAFFAEATATNVSHNGTMTLIFAAYDKDGRMTDTHYLYTDMPVGQTFTVGQSFGNISNAAVRLRVFVLDTFGGMTPLSEDITFSA